MKTHWWRRGVYWAMILAISAPIVAGPVVRRWEWWWQAPWGAALLIALVMLWSAGSPDEPVAKWSVLEFMALGVSALLVLAPTLS